MNHYNYILFDGTERWNAGTPVERRLFSQIKGFVLILFEQNATGGCRWAAGEVSVIGSVSSSKEAHPVALLFRGAETHIRSVLKAVSWRTLGTLDTFAISWFMTGRVEIAGSIAGLEIITKIAWYYLHERVWAAIPWGRR